MVAFVTAVPAVYFAYLGKLFSPAIDPAYFRDFGVLISFAEHVFQHGHYLVGVHYYPPPAAVYFRIFGAAGEEFAFRLHLIVQSAAYIVTVIAWANILGLDRQRHVIGVVAAALLASLFYVAFELQMHNVNMLSLALVSVSLWQRHRPWLAGAMIALTIAIKPYGSLLILLWMVWNREWRWCLASTFWTVILAVVVPVTVFGAEAAVRLYGEWVQSVATTAEGEWITAYGFSLRGGVAEALDLDASDTGIVWSARGFEVAWLIALALLFMPALTRSKPPGAETLAMEASVLLIAPLPLGGLQQIARSAVFLVPALVLASSVLDRRASWTARAVILTTFGAMTVGPRLLPIGQQHTVLTAVLCLSVLLSLALVRFRRSAVVSDRPDP